MGIPPRRKLSVTAAALRDTERLRAALEALAVEAETAVLFLRPFYPAQASALLLKVLAAIEALTVDRV